MPSLHTYTGDPAGRSSFYCRTMIFKNQRKLAYYDASPYPTTSSIRWLDCPTMSVLYVKYNMHAAQRE
jgi:hypothetical protein